MPPPKKKVKLVKKVPSDAQWCLDRSNHLSFREFIEKWDCLDRNQAQQRFGYILSEYFKSKSAADMKIREDYKNWISSADYVRFLATRSQSNTLLKTKLGCSEIIDIVTEQRLKSLQAAAASSGASSGDSSTHNASSDSSPLNASSNSSAHRISEDSSAPGVSGDSPAPNVSSNSSAPVVSDGSSAPDEPTSPTNTMLIEVRDYLVSVMTHFTNEDTNDNPWMFEDINVSHLFRKYQATTSEILVKHKTLPVESYVHELASLTHIIFLCKDQHSEIAERVFSLETLQQLTVFLEKKYKKL